jgi:hypothetical protein
MGGLKQLQSGIPSEKKWEKPSKAGKTVKNEFL